jgi:transcriptional regulator ATRX
MFLIAILSCLSDHCMVQFVKPNLLGTQKEFRNRFMNPISNGQFEDSTAHDVKIMKRRAHVLHKMLEGSVQVHLFTALFSVNIMYRCLT